MPMGGEINFIFKFLFRNMANTPHPTAASSLRWKHEIFVLCTLYLFSKVPKPQSRINIHVSDYSKNNHSRIEDINYCFSILNTSFFCDSYFLCHELRWNQCSLGVAILLILYYSSALLIKMRVVQSACFCVLLWYWNWYVEHWNFACLVPMYSVYSTL